MATETKTFKMTNTGAWSGEFTVVINNDEANAKVSVTATMTVYETWGATPREGDYVFYMYIRKDGVDVATGGSATNTVYTWLTDKSAGGHKTSCSATFSYNGSCSIAVGGWATAYSGALAGTSVEGYGSWTVEAYRPPTPITLNVASVQMGKQLMITLNRAYGDYTHTLYYKFGTGSETSIASNVGTSYAWTVPDLAAYCNNAVSGTCTLRAVTYKGSTKIGETTKTVTITVQDPTTPSVPDSEVTLGAAATVSCPRQSANFTVRLTLEFQGTTANIQEGKINSSEWTPGYDLAKQIPNLTYATGTVSCVTLNGTAVVGTRTTTIRVYVPDNDTTRPKISDVQLEPVSELGSDFSGLYIRGKTGLKATITAASEYSTISEYAVTAGSADASGNPAVISLLVNDGNVTVTVKVIDARGYSTTATQTVYVYSYRRPKVVPYTGYSEVICERAHPSGELSSKGTYLAIKAGKSFTSISPEGKNLNPCLLRYRYKLSASGSYGSWVTLLDNESAALEISTLISNVVSSLSSSYDVELQAMDALGETHTLYFAIMTEAISFVLYDGEDGAGFGKYPEAPHVVDIASHMTLLVRGKLVVSSTDWEDLGLAENIKESVYSYGRKEYSSCFYLVSNGNHIYVAFNCGYTYAGTAAVINAKPIPEDYRPKQSVFSFCPMNNRCIALVSVNPDGYVRLEWVQKIADTVTTGNAEVVWIDGYLNYWT